MDRYELWLDGVSSRDIGIELQEALRVSAAVPNVTAISVAGRNGDLHIYDGSFKNRTAKAGAYVYAPDKVKRSFGRINEWLFGGFGYRRLETDDDREHYMLARVNNGADVEARIRRIAPFELSFDCKPQRFLKDGEEPIEIMSNMSLLNPTKFSSLPLYKVNCIGDGTLTIGAYTAKFQGIDGYVYYDAETQNAYKGSTNQNALVYAPYGLPFEGGEQVVNFTGEITSIEIIPRWWEL